MYQWNKALFQFQAQPCANSGCLYSGIPPSLSAAAHTSPENHGVLAELFSVTETFVGWHIFWDEKLPHGSTSLSTNHMEGNTSAQLCFVCLKKMTFTGLNACLLILNETLTDKYLMRLVPSIFYTMQLK